MLVERRDPQRWWRLVMRHGGERRGHRFSLPGFTVNFERRSKDLSRNNISI